MFRWLLDKRMHAENWRTETQREDAMILRSVCPVLLLCCLPCRSCSCPLPLAPYLVPSTCWARAGSAARSAVLVFGRWSVALLLLVVVLAAGCVRRACNSNGLGLRRPYPADPSTRNPYPCTRCPTRDAGVLQPLQRLLRHILYRLRRQPHPLRPRPPLPWCVCV